MIDVTRVDTPEKRSWSVMEAPLTAVPAPQPATGPAPCAQLRPRVAGKFICVGEQQLYVRGVTYGPFRPDGDGKEYYDTRSLERDFSKMAAHGVNAIRIPHTAPPRSLLDVAQRYGLRVMVGLGAELFIGGLGDRRKLDLAEAAVRAKVRACAGHPAVLCYVLGNEIPASVVRWRGPRRIERYLKRLCSAVKAEDPEGLVTYANYPTTEYLQLPFLDLACFNVYLESREQLEAYLARLHNIAGDRPVIMSEIGLDSLRNGEEAQALSLGWQVQTAFASGCAGVFIFAWTDEWHRAGEDVQDWAFGLTRSDRQPKPALRTVGKAFGEVPFPSRLPWPRVSVVVCSHNGARTIRECLEGLRKLDYPNFEVIVVDDGSTDGTAAIAADYDFQLIRTPNLGLSSARNTGLKAATGEIVAYIDDDAYPDPHWLQYLASTFLTTTYAAVGGPNIPPPGDGPIAHCVANAPGGPAHVLLSDREAEHIPGCNMAFRKTCLEAISGFDPRFRVAGDDVDVCWRIRQRGWSIGFSPGAMVWHHRRNSVRAYRRQQFGYGAAEALLEKKWPEKYNGAGHITWAGRVYGWGLAFQPGLSNRIYHGLWGSAPFQSLYQPHPGSLWSMGALPEWYLLLLLCAIFTALGSGRTPMLLAGLPLALAALVPAARSVLSAAHAPLPAAPRSRAQRLKLRSLIAFLHLLQPAARLCGRLRFGLLPWWRSAAGLCLPRPRTVTVWSPGWEAAETRLLAVEAALRAVGARVRRGGNYDRWDLDVRGGVLGGARLLMGIEDWGGSGGQVAHFRMWPNFSALGLVLTAISALCTLPAPGKPWAGGMVVGWTALVLAIAALRDCAAATAAFRHALRQAGAREA